MLTGKAKKDFYNWINGNGYHEEVVYKSVINCLIIEWLDSVGIYVQIEICDSCIAYSIKDFRSIILHDCYLGFDTRQQATEQAIIKANEMYNSQ